MRTLVRSMLDKDVESLYIDEVTSSMVITPDLSYTVAYTPLTYVLEPTF